MKKLLLTRAVTAFAVLLSSAAVQAQIAGADAFIQGTYVEIGVNTCGAYASNTTPPAGYVVTGLTGLNFIADSDMDGWEIGSPEHCGDYAIPGSPVEGWGIEIGGTSYHNTDKTCFTSDVDGEISSYTSAGDSIEVIWEGSVAGVDILQRSVLHTGDLYFLTWITLTNTGGSALSDIYYKRNIDPDNEQLWGGGYSTINTIESSPYSGDIDAVVTAVGTLYGCYLGVGARNPNARVSSGGFGTAGGAVSDAYDGISPYALTGSITADAAIQMNFYVASLPAGGSTTFAMAHVFGEEQLEEALEATYVGGYDDCAGAPEVGGAFSTASSTCASDMFTVSVDVASAVGITFQWQSSADGASYSNIAGATGSSYSTTQTDATYYQAVVTCTASGDATTSSAVFVDNVCPGCMDETALNYNEEANEDDGSCFYGYTISECDYASSIMDVPAGLTEICLSDDVVSAGVSIGFSFPFYGTDYTTAYIGSNGYMNFSGTTLSACCSGQFLPNASYPASIFFGQEDLDPNSCIDGNIYAWTEGAPGSQIFVVDFTNVPHYPGPEGTFPVTVQVQLHQATGDIKIVTTEYNGDGGNSTMGLNLDGTLAQTVEGRNSAAWSAYDECILFSMEMVEPFTCEATTAPEVAVISSTVAEVSWSAVDGATQYVFVLRDNTTGEKWTRNTTETFMSLPALTAGHSYTTRVRTNCYPEGMSAPSPQTDFAMPLRLGLTEEGVNIYPNPNDGQFRIQLNGYENLTVEMVVTNTLGQTVYSEQLTVDAGVSAHDINLSQLAAGTYIVKLLDGENVQTQTVVIE